MAAIERTNNTAGDGNFSPYANVLGVEINQVKRRGRASCNFKRTVRESLT